MRKVIVVVSLLLAVGGGACFGLYAYRQGVRRANERQHAEAMFELVQQMRDVPSGTFEGLQRFLSLSNSATNEWLDLDPASHLSQTLNSFQLAVTAESNSKLEKRNAELEIETAQLRGRAPGASLRNRQREATTKVKEIEPIVETCQRDVEHYFYGTASTGTCERDMDRYSAMYPDKPGK